MADEVVVLDGDFTALGDLGSDETRAADPERWERLSRARTFLAVEFQDFGRCTLHCDIVLSKRQVLAIRRHCSDG